MTDNFNAFATLSSIKQVYLRLHDAHLLFHTAAQSIIKLAGALHDIGLDRPYGPGVWSGQEQVPQSQKRAR